jgi:hypothetical protein
MTSKKGNGAVPITDDNILIDVGNISGATSISKTLDDLSNADPKDILKIVTSQMKLLNIFYNLGLDQAKRSFLLAIVAAAVGLAFFIAAVAFVLTRPVQDASVISLISGALVEVISAINFYLYNKTSSQLSTFYLSLEKTQRYLLANSICEGLEGDLKQNTRAHLIRNIAGAVMEEPIQKS